MSDITGAGQAISGGLQAAATISAADTQADAVRHGQDLEQQRYNTTRTDLQGYNTQGRSAQDQGLTLLGNYNQNAVNYQNQMGASIPGQTLQDTANFLPTSQNNSVVPGSMTQAQLEATPGYQFTLAQGLKSTQASAAAKGLGVSGAAMKGAASYATGLANQTYKDQFGIQQQQFSDQLGLDAQNFGQSNTNFNNILNLRQGQFNQGQAQESDWQNIGNFSQGALSNQLTFLGSQASLGENAAAQTGSVGASLASASASQGIAGAGAIGNTLTNGASGISSSINSYLNNQQQNALLQKYYGGSTTGSYGAASTGSSGDDGTYGSGSLY